MRVAILAVVACLSLGGTTVAASPSPEPTSESPGPLGPTGSDDQDSGRRGDDRSDVPVETGDDDFVATAGSPSGVIDYDVTNNPGPRSAPRCTYEQAFLVVAAPAQYERENPVTGDIERLYLRRCSGEPSEYVWVPTGVSVQDLIDGAVQQVRAQLPVPVSDINPDPADGGWVNLGMWLAIVDPGVTVARASVGPVWVEGRGVVSGFSVDFGNGEVRECDGLGVRIEDVVPDLDTFEEGPCGFTYRVSSPEGDPYRVMVTSVYEVSFVTSSGRSGTVGSVDRSVTFDYDIDELQTVGRSN